MRKRFFLLVTFLSVLSVPQITHAQVLDEILHRHFEAVGQRELLKKKTYISEATIEQMGMEIPMSMKVKRPDKFRMEMEMQGQKMVQAFDGEKGWMIAPWMSQEPRELKGNELNQIKEQANLDGDLFNYTKKGKQASLLGKVNTEGKSMYNVELNNMDGSVKNYFIDAEDFLIKKVIMKIKTQDETIEMQQNISEYKNINGVMMPSKIESKSPTGTAKITFNKISFNEEIEESEFKMPEK
jgi:outer membrane lipoprotein-sorting protein